MEHLANDRAVSCETGRGALEFTSAFLSPAQPAAQPPLRPPLRTGSGTGLSDKALERTIAYIHANLFDNLSLGDLARIACVSRFHFARMFRLRTGFSPMKYVQSQRIERAKHLLRHDDANISTIAAALGFFDQSHFSRVFRKVTGVSPGRYAQRDTRARQATG
ncbi:MULTISPECIES: AraC family transcriptional regulator [unclassified Lysobacter]|uniref:helix-turn-helix domain-containing protein n=1 Tax=unclassified Lysobacter TaxID=2635362 RepID=UPI001C241B5A|nr:AraC family transcriptional regulator [Lysobacter sp. MMG2]MBU8978232.1 AraC family transcriptional regulator [Lysobacter sp. MMG2]